MSTVQEEKFHRNQYVFTQGQEPEYIHIVCKGEFELLRSKKNKYTLMDPIKEDRISSGRNMTDH